MSEARKRLLIEAIHVLDRIDDHKAGMLRGQTELLDSAKRTIEALIEGEGGRTLGCIGSGGDCGPPDRWRRREPYGWYGMVPCPVHVRDDPFTIEMRRMIRDAGKGYLLDTEEFLKVHPEFRCDPPDTHED